MRYLKKIETFEKRLDLETTGFSFHDRRPLGKLPLCQPSKLVHKNNETPPTGDAQFGSLN